MEGLPDYGAYGRKTFKRWEVVHFSEILTCEPLKGCLRRYGAQRKESLQREASRTQGISIELNMVTESPRRMVASRIPSLETHV
jgi:hypothetical protein